MYRVSVNRKLLVERQRTEETKNLVESFFAEIAEAVASSDVEKIMSKYMGKVKDPTARNDFLMQAASFLGRKSNVSPEELDLVLRQHYAKNYDPAKIQRGQTPAQRASAQAAKSPPPLPPQKPDFGKPNPSLPSLSKLASQETEPFWKKQGLPPPESFGQPPEQGVGEPEELPFAKSSDVKTVGKKKAGAPKAKAKPSEPPPEEPGKEVDMDTLGSEDPSAKEKPAKSEPASKKKKKKPAGKKKIKSSDLEDVPEPSVGGSSELPMPKFSSLVKQKLAPGADLGDPKWKVGDTVSIGHAGSGYKVKNRTGSWYNLTRDGERYVFIPFKGLRKIRG